VVFGEIIIAKLQHLFLRFLSLFALIYMSLSKSDTLCVI
ncbi:MAG: hypothetical protein ACI8WB_003241, partial [Phenylobacterium sp.]